MLLKWSFFIYSFHFFFFLDGRLHKIAKDGQLLCCITEADEALSIIKNYHEDICAHAASGNTIAMVCSKYFWPGVTKDIKDFVSNLRLCLYISCHSCNLKMH